MFSGLRQGSQVFIMNKENTLEVVIGTVSKILTPLTYTAYPQSNIDIEVRIGDRTCEFKQLPSSSSIVNYNNGKTVISDSRELMCSEVETMQKTSKEILEHIPYHKDVLEKCEEMLKVLNPQFAKQKEQEDKINNLECKVNTVENKIDDLSVMIKKALNL